MSDVRSVAEPTVITNVVEPREIPRPEPIRDLVYPLAEAEGPPHDGASRGPTPYYLREGSSDNDPNSYPNFFQLVEDPRRTSTTDEAFFTRSCNAVLEGAKTFGRGSDLENQMADLRDEFAIDIREIAERFLKGESPLQSIEDLASRNGEFKNAIRALSDANRAVNIERDSTGVIQDVQFNLRGIRLTEEQEQLFVEIQKVITVIKVVFASRLQKSDPTSIY